MDKRAEIEKLKDYMMKMEAIIRTSPNPGQVDRVKKEYRRYAQKMSELVPGFDPAKHDLNQIGAAPPAAPQGRTGPSHRTSQASTASSNPEPARPSRTGASPASGGARPSSGGYTIFDKYPVEKASPNSSDPDVNMTASVLRVIQREYWPALSDQYCRLDFSNGAERDGIRMKLDNVLRNLKVLTETIEEYAMAEKQDFREQLLKMKNRQSRVFMLETNEYLKELILFLKKLVGDVQTNGGIILNKEELLRFDGRYYDAKALEGRRLAEAIKEFHLYLSEAVERLRIPDIR